METRIPNTRLCGVTLFFVGCYGVDDEKQTSHSILESR